MANLLARLWTRGSDRVAAGAGFDPRASILIALWRQVASRVSVFFGAPGSVALIAALQLPITDKGLEFSFSLRGFPSRSRRDHSKGLPGSITE
jgi:hypothetical protein